MIFRGANIKSPVAPELRRSFSTAGCERCIVTVIREHKYIRGYARAKDKKFNVNNALNGENDSEGGCASVT